MYTQPENQAVRLKALPQLLAALIMTFSGCKKPAEQNDDSSLNMTMSSQALTTNSQDFKQKYRKSIEDSLDKSLDNLIDEQLKLATERLGNKNIKVDGKEFGNLKEELELTKKFLKDNGVNLSLSLRTYLSNRGINPEQLKNQQIDERYLNNVFATALAYKDRGMMNYMTLEDLSEAESAELAKSTEGFNLGTKYDVDCAGFLRGAARTGNPSFMKNYKYCKKHGSKPLFSKISVDCDKASMAKVIAGAGAAVCTAAGAVLCLMTAGIGCGLMAVCSAAAGATEVGAAAAQAIGGCCKGKAGHADGGAGC